MNRIILYPCTIVNIIVLYTQIKNYIIKPLYGCIVCSKNMYNTLIPMYLLLIVVVYDN